MNNKIKLSIITFSIGALALLSFLLLSYSNLSHDLDRSLDRTQDLIGKNKKLFDENDSLKADNEKLKITLEQTIESDEEMKFSSYNINLLNV